MDAPTPPTTAPANDPGAGGQRPPGYDVFISHSSKDKAAADAVCHALESRNIRCWIAPRDIRPGMNWGEAILTGLSSVRIMALLLSSNANSSPQIEREVERAVHHNLIVIPVRLEEVTPGASLEYFLSTSHWLDAFQGSLNAHLERLADTVQSILTGQPSSPRAATVPVVGTSGTAVPPRAAGGNRTGLIVGALAAVALVAGAAVWWFAGRSIPPSPAPAAQVSAGNVAEETPAPAARSSNKKDDAPSDDDGVMASTPAPAEEDAASPAPSPKDE